jgi:hypothetical protein
MDLGGYTQEPPINWFLGEILETYPLKTLDSMMDIPAPAPAPRGQTNERISHNLTP